MPGEAEGSQGGAGRFQAWARDVRGLLYMAYSELLGVQGILRFQGFLSAFCARKAVYTLGYSK